MQHSTLVMDGYCFTDGFGRRFRPDETGGKLEWLRLCEELSSARQIEPLLVERAARLGSFHHPAVARVRRIERRGRGAGSVVLVSDAVPGGRLSDLLPSGGLDGALGWLPLLQGVVAGVAALHACGRDVSHGAIGPERIVIRPDGQPVLVEPVLGAAVEPLGIARLRLWSQYRVPVPPTAGTARFDQRCDVLQIGVLALALGIGRLLAREDFPNRLPQLLAEACAKELPRDRQACLPGLRSWMARALQLDARSAFPSAVEAEAALTELLAEEPADEIPVERAGERGAEQAFPLPVAVLPPVRPTTPAASGPLLFPGVPAAAAGHTSRRAPRWSVARQVLRISSVAVGLVTLWGATYLGARSYLGLDLPIPDGVLVVDSRPAGLEVLVNGSRHGVTPTTIELRPGDYTLALRNGRSTTLVPVTVAPGQRRLERIELQRGGRTPKRISQELRRQTGK